MSKILSVIRSNDKYTVTYENDIVKSYNKPTKTINDFLNVNNAIVSINDNAINTLSFDKTVIDNKTVYALKINDKFSKTIINQINNSIAINRTNTIYDSIIRDKMINNKSNNNDFLTTKYNFYNWMLSYNQITADNNYIDIVDTNHISYIYDDKHNVVDVKYTYLHLYKTAKLAKYVNDKYNEAINSLCMIFVLSVLKKLSNVTSTTRTAKTKKDSTFYAMRTIKNDLITSYNAYNDLLLYSNDNNDMSTLVLADTLKRVCSIDGLDLLSVAKSTLLECINKAKNNIIDVNINDVNLLDKIYSYTDINKRVWTDITDNTYIKDVIKNTDNSYTVIYTSDKTKQFNSYDKLTKTAKMFLNHKEMLNNNINCKEKNLYLVTKNTCIASQVCKAIRYYIQSEKSVSSSNSYAYIADITDITDNDGNTHSFNTYQRLKHYDNSLIYCFDSKNLNSKEYDIFTINTILDNIKLSDKYKNILNEALKGYKYPTIAKKLNYNINTCKSSLREIKKKLLNCDLVSYKAKYNQLISAINDCKCVIADGNKYIKLNKLVKSLYKDRLKHISSITAIKTVSKNKNKRYTLLAVKRDDIIVKNVFKKLPITYQTMYAYKKSICFNNNSCKQYNNFINDYKTVLDRKKTAITNLKSYKSDLYDICKNAIDNNNKLIIANNAIINNTSNKADVISKAKSENSIYKRDNNAYRKTLLTMYKYKVNSCLTYKFNTNVNTVFAIAQNRFNCKDNAVRDNKNYKFNFNSNIVDSLIIPVEHKTNDKTDIINYRLSSDSMHIINDKYTIHNNNITNINNINVSYTDNNINYYNSTTYYYNLYNNDFDVSHISSISNVITVNTYSNSYLTAYNNSSIAYNKYNISNTFITDTYAYNYSDVIKMYINTAMIDNSLVWIIVKPPIYHTTTKTITTLQLYYYDLNNIRKECKPPILDKKTITKNLPCIKEHGIYKKCKVVKNTNNYNNLTVLNKAFFNDSKVR